jgi:threonine synthase
VITTGLACTSCDALYAFELRYHCERCGFPLAVTYAEGDGATAPSGSVGEGVWRHSDSLPSVAPENRVTLGEGGTPLLATERLGEAFGFERLLVKSEGVNPTGSFKDRPTAVGVSVALEFGLDTVVVSSTGNAGVSLAAYAARAGLRAVVVASDRVPTTKLAPIAAHGATIVRIRGSVSDAFWLAHQAAQAWGWMNLTSTFLNPYTVEGDKTVAYELAAQLGCAPDYVIVPVSVGPLLVGIFRGFRELEAKGVVEQVPALVAAQAARCAPIAAAFASGGDSVSAWSGNLDTVAGGIADPLTGYEQDGTYALRVVRESGGCAVACEEDEILAATRALAEQEGLFVEPTGAVSVAALAALAERDPAARGRTVVAIATGHGLKTQAALVTDEADRPAVEPTLAALAELLSVREETP